MTRGELELLLIGVGLVGAWLDPRLSLVIGAVLIALALVKAVA